jgi:DNA-binding response OmpR family regulator
MTRLGRMLIVDDDLSVREVLTEYFETRGYAVSTAADGHDAAAAFTHQRPDVVLLDMRMPGMDGLQVLKRLREIDADVAVIMVTANEDLELARETLTVGAFDYVAKPFDFEHLAQAVSAAVVHSARTPFLEDPAPAPRDVWSRLATDVFRVVRSMSTEARASTGARLEDAVLEAARQAMAGRSADVARQLAEIELLVGVASGLGDLSPAARSTIDAALKTTHTALPAR